MTQTEFQTTGGGQSQCLIILGELTTRPGQWVSALRLHQICGSLAVHSRINDLRQRGHQIENRVETVNGKRHSSYRLVISGKELQPQMNPPPSDYGVASTDEHTNQQTN